MAGKPKKTPEVSFYGELGRAIRLARIAAGKTQVDIAEHLDLSFQQVQKYEKGTNRIPIQELVSLAAYLEVPISSLINSSKTDAEFKSAAQKLRAKGLHTLLESWGAIKDQSMREAILHLAKCAAGLKR
jgi:transcriptional regulator with XRE-family HTH domain